MLSQKIIIISKKLSNPNGTKTTMIELETNCKVLTVKF